MLGDVARAASAAEPSSETAVDPLELRRLQWEIEQLRRQIERQRRMLNAWPDRRTVSGPESAEDDRTD
jgi:hypothetical protein